MALRAAHGHARGSGPQIEILPPDELPNGTGADTDRPGRGPDGRFAPGNRIATNKGVRAASGRLGKMAVDPLYAPFLAWGRRYGAHRRTELAKSHGGAISAGVGALVESAAQMLAQSRFIAAKAGAEGDPDLMKRSGSMACDARQTELAAWELAEREAKTRRAQVRQDPQAVLRARLAAARAAREGSGQQDGRRPEQAADEVAPGGAVARGGAVEPVE